MKNVLVFLIFVFTIFNAESKDKKYLTVEEECAKSHSIFVGTVVSCKDSVYEFEVIKIWKGKANEVNKITIIQDCSNSNCEGFLLNATYMVYADTIGVNDYSRTTCYTDSFDPDFLDKMFESKIFNVKIIDSLDLLRGVIFFYDIGNIDLKKKNVLIYTNNKFYKLNELPIDRGCLPFMITYSYPCYQLVEKDLSNDNIDFIIKLSFRDIMFRNTELSSELKKKIMRNYKFHKHFDK